MANSSEESSSSVPEDQSSPTSFSHPPGSSIPPENPSLPFVQKPTSPMAVPGQTNPWPDLDEEPAQSPLNTPDGRPTFGGAHQTGALDDANPFRTDAASVESARTFQRRLDETSLAQVEAYRRKQRKTSIVLFVLTFLSTFLVASGYFPLEYLVARLVPSIGASLERSLLPETPESFLLKACRHGLEYSIPLMTILFCHEMGHYLQSRKNRVPASLPYFIPLPLPPMGTMGAVIFQGRGVATRRQMFDIAVWGPLAGLAITIPVLWYGLLYSKYVPRQGVSSLEFGEPLLVQWMIAAMHGPAPDGKVFMLNGIGFAGWVGVFITAMNLLPVGQLDGGHILYTLIGRRAHVVAYLVIGAGVISMVVRQNYTFSLLLILLLMTGPKHPPTANDREPLGIGRHILGWLTLSFLIIGFTPTPISTM